MQLTGRCRCYAADYCADRSADYCSGADIVMRDRASDGSSGEAAGDCSGSRVWTAVAVIAVVRPGVAICVAVVRAVTVIRMSVIGIAVADVWIGVRVIGIAVVGIGIGCGIGVAVAITAVIAVAAVR